MMDDKDDLEEITFQVRDDYEHHEARNAMPYDGILGSLPEWVPKPIQRYFERYRNLVIDTWGYKPVKAVKILDQFHESSWLLGYSEKYPDGRDIDFAFFSTIIGYLYQLRWALELPTEDALSLLSGEFAKSGYRSSKNLGKGRPRGGLPWESRRGDGR